MPAITRWSVRSVLLAAVFSAVAESPYLPSVGPPALRFLNPPVERSAPAIRLPPLLTMEPRLALPAALVAPVVPAESAVASLPNPLVPGIDAALSLSQSMQAASAVSNGVDVVRLDSENLTPQMFMKFFSGQPGTNASGVSIIAPLPFIPPAPPAPSSTAAFQTTPPAKP